MTTTDGGPAFPCLSNVAHNSDWLSDDGMSLRDWFAGLAMQGLGANAEYAAATSHAEGAHLAKVSYEIADAMLAERAKKEPEPCAT